MELCLSLPLDFSSKVLFEQYLNKGAYGSVYRAKYEDQVYAIKRQNYKEPGEVGISQKVLIEANMLVRLRTCPCIIQLEGIYTQIKDLFLVTELLDGDLMVFIRTLSFDERMKHVHVLIKDTLQAMAVLQKENIQHFDIKPHNILIRSLPTGGYRFVLTDFGLARAADLDTRFPDAIATVFYRPPELILALDRNCNQVPIFKTDIWSWGILICDYFWGDHFIGGEINKILETDRLFSEQAQEAIVLNDIWKTLKITSEQVPFMIESIRTFQVNTYLPWLSRFEPSVRQRIESELSETEINGINHALHLNGSFRIPARPLFHTMYEGRVSPDLILTEPSRSGLKSDSDLGSLYRSMCGQIWCHPIAMICAMELFTRLNHPRILDKPRLHLLVCYRLSSAYIEPVGIDYVQLNRLYNYALDKFDAAEREVLSLSHFYVYNPRIRDICPRIINGEPLVLIRGKMSRIMLEMYSQPLSTWFL